jgi:outer membrane protein TolC
MATEHAADHKPESLTMKPLLSPFFCLQFFCLRPASLFLSFVLISGCARYQPKPISASTAAQDFEGRTLNDERLGRFLAANHDTNAWPRKPWDLSALTLAAFYYHPDLDVVRARWGVAGGARVTAGERPNPSVSFSPTYDSTTPPPWILGLSFDIPVETAGKRGYRMTQARHLSEAARLNLAATAWQVRSRVRRSLLELYAARETESALQEQVNAQAKLAELLAKQVEAGAATQVELAQARINLNTTRLSLQDAQRQAAEGRVQLASAIGVPVTAFDGIEISFADLDRFPTELTAREVRRQAVLNRNDILGALAEYAASQSALQLEIARQYPDLHLGPGYQLDQTDNKWTLGATLTLPVLNQNQGTIAQAKARREEAAARFVSVQAQAAGEIDRAVAGYSAATEQAATAKSLLSELEKRRRSTQSMFEAGEVDAIAVASAQTELSAGAMARLNSLLKAQQALAALEDAVQSPLLWPATAQPWETNPRSSLQP